VLNLQDTGSSTGFAFTSNHPTQKSKQLKWNPKMTPWKRKFPLVTINFQIPCEFSGVYSEGFIDMLCHQLLKKCETNNKKHKNNIPHRFLSKGEPTTANSIFSCFPCFKKHVFLCAPSSLSLVSTICIIDAQFFGFLKCL